MSMTEIDERIVTKTIIERFYRKLLEHVQVDVAIVGGEDQRVWLPDTPWPMGDWGLHSSHCHVL